MDVVVLGGHGKIGFRLLKLLVENGHRARGVVRRPEHEADLKEIGAEAMVVDIENKDLEAQHVSGADAVVMAAGAGPGSGAARKRTVDYGGAIRLIEAARNHEIPRYLMISAIRVEDPDSWPQQMVPYYEAKRDADEALVRSGLDYTIVRPGRLSDDPGAGKVEVAPKLEHGGEVPRDDVAAVLLECLGAENTIGKGFDLVSGERPIAEAIRSL